MQFLQGPPCSAPDATTELALSRVIELPDAKPPIAKVLDQSVDVTVEQGTLIDTALITELPNHSRVPVRKVIVKGASEVTIKYVAAVKDQQVHAAIFDVPFETLVEWPGGPAPGTPICVYVTTEHFQVEPLSPCTLLAMLVIRLDIFER